MMTLPAGAVIEELIQLCELIIRIISLSRFTPHKFIFDADHDVRDAHYSTLSEPLLCS